MTIKKILRFFPLVLLPIFSVAQEAAIMNTNMQIYASLNSKPMAWATTAVEIHLNKTTGAFTVILFINNLSAAIVNPDFTPTGENLGKHLTLTGTIPVNDVLQNSGTVINMNVDMIANFNNIDFPTNFSFTILRINPDNSRGFSVMMRGSLSISKLQISNLNEFDDELGISLSFTGF